MRGARGCRIWSAQNLSFSNCMNAMMKFIKLKPLRNNSKEFKKIFVRKSLKSNTQKQTGKSSLRLFCFSSVLELDFKTYAAVFQLIGSIVQRKRKEKTKEARLHGRPNDLSDF